MTALVDPAGWLLIVGTIVLVVRWRVFAAERWIRAIVLAAVLLRTAYSVANVAVGPIFGLGRDAQAFHLEAVGFAQGRGVSVGLVNGWVYSAFVGVLYRATKGGLLLGQQLSILAVVFSAAAVLRVLSALRVPAGRAKWVLAILLFLPAGVVYTSGTLREAFQQLLFLLTVEFALKTIDRPTVKVICCMGAAALVGGSLHGAVAVAGAAVAFGSILIAGAVRAPEGVRQSAAMRRLLPIVLIGLVVAGASVPSVIFPYKVGGGTLSAAARYRSGTPPARADYLRLRPGEGVGLSDLPVVFGLYEIAPLPWNVENGADAVASVEAAVRVVLILLALLALVHTGRRNYTGLLKALLLAGGWLTIELAWSLGTTNWGTGARHHIVGFPLLLILCALGPAGISRRRPIGPDGERLTDDASGRTPVHLVGNGM